MPALMKKNRRPLLLLVVIFIAPLAFAFWLYYGSSWRPAQRTNHGELVQPAITLPPLPYGSPSANLLSGKWSLVVVGNGESGCDEGCRAALIYARQTWQSLASSAPGSSGYCSPGMAVVTEITCATSTRVWRWRSCRTAP